MSFLRILNAKQRALLKAELQHQDVLLSLKEAQVHKEQHKFPFQRHLIPLLISTFGRAKISKSMVPPFAAPSERSKRTTLSAAPCMNKHYADQQ